MYLHYKKPPKLPERPQFVSSPNYNLSTELSLNVSPIVIRGVLREREREKTVTQPLPLNEARGEALSAEKMTREIQYGN